MEGSAELAQEIAEIDAVACVFIADEDAGQVVQKPQLISALRQPADSYGSSTIEPQCVRKRTLAGIAMNQISAGFSPDDHALVDGWTYLQPFGLSAHVVLDRSAKSQLIIEVFRPHSDQPLWIITVQPDGAVVLVRDTDGAVPLTLQTIEAALGQIAQEEAGRRF